VVVQETSFYEEKSLALHSMSFDKDLKKLVSEHVNSKGKRIKDSNMNLNGIQASMIAKIHKSL
jgi:hypothetical protein